MPVRHSPPRSLAQRIMLSFALLVTFVAGFYAFALYQSIEFTEQQLISGILRDEVARAVDTLERGETPRLPEDTRLYGAPPLEAPPPAMRGLPEGFGELSNNGDFFVHTGAWRGEPLVLTRDQLGFEDTERVFRRITLFSVLAVFFLGLLAGWILARNIMKPVKTLSDEVRKASAARTYEPLSVELTNDEVGELARICDGAMKRLHEALQREKAFTGDVSHELRTPLTVIETSAELLSMTPLSPAQAKQVERITRSAGDMRELMSLFLSFARLSNETTGPEPDSAAGILKAVADTWMGAVCGRKGPRARASPRGRVPRRLLARHARHRRQQPREERRRLHRKRRGHDHGNVRGLHCLRLGTGTRRRRGRPHLRARRARQCSRRRRLGRRTRPFDRLAHLPPLGLDGNGGQGP